MVLSPEFCESRASEASTAAVAATLDNVRDRELRSAAAWRLLASQVQAVRDGRKAIETARGAEEMDESEDTDE